MELVAPKVRRTYPNATGSFELWEKVVREIVGQPTEPLTLLDLCCNECTVTSRLGCVFHVGVDVVDWSTRKSIPYFVCMDVVEYLKNIPTFPLKRRADLAICSDGIEHLTKPQGLKLLAEMTRVAKLAIIFTPLGDYMVEPDSTHPDKHRSGWMPEELEGLGWSCRIYPKWHETLGVGAFFAFKGQLK